MKRSTLVLVVLAACGFAGPAQPAPDEPPSARRQILFDPEADAGARQQELARLRQAALRGDAWAQADLGSLYRLGEAHPARLLPRDDVQAESYLSNAAIGGALIAMAGMAELELRRGQPYAALIWAQLHAHYTNLASASSAAEPERRPPEAYKAYLLQRCFDALESGVDESALQRDLEAFVAQHDAGVRRGMLASGPAVSGSERLRALPGSWAAPYRWSLLKLPPRSSARVSYLAGVAPDGRIDRLLIIDSLPDALPAERLAEWVIESGRFNPVEDGAKRRWGHLPLSFSDGVHGIRPATQP
jgi:hypothetical protein